MGLLDTNIFVYAHDLDSRWHGQAKDFLKNSIERGTVCFSRQIFIESLRVFTEKINKPLSPKEAWLIVDYYVSNKKIPMLTMTDTSLSILKELCIGYDVRGIRIFYATLVAMMLTHGVKTIYTRNVKDFKHFKEIKTVDPLR